MKRIRNLGLAALLALALTATIGAASASAAGYFAAGMYPATVKGASKNGRTALLTLGGKTFECYAPSFNAQWLEGPSATLTTTQVSKDGECQRSVAGSIEKGMLELNGCQLSFEAGSLKESFLGDYVGELSTGPEKCGPITIQMSVSICKYTIDPAGFHGSAGFTNSGEDLDIHASISGFSFTVTGVGCGKPGTGTYDAQWEAGATNAAGTSTSLNVENAGIYLAGKSEGEPQPQIASDIYPNSISSYSKAFSFSNSGSQAINCASTSVQGELIKATTELALAPKYGECTMKLGVQVLTTVVTINGCKHTLGVLNAGPPYAGTLGMACEGVNAIEFKSYTGGGSLACTFKLGSQAGVKGVGLANLAVEGDAAIQMNAAVSGVSYERKGILCGGTKVASDGSINYSTTLLGS